MFPTKLQKSLILNLKVRISKILKIPSKLRQEDKNSLEELFETIDKSLLYSGDKVDEMFENFQNSLNKSALIFSSSDKKYIREHILPVINKISKNEWGEEK